MYMTDKSGWEMDVPTLCEIYDCNECSRFGDDCDGNDSVCDREYTVKWCDEDNRNIHTETVSDLEAAMQLADAHNGRVYDKDENRVYPEDQLQVSYEDLRAINDVIVKHAGSALAQLSKS